MADLVTLAEYKAYAGINQPNQDDAIEAIIPKVSAFVKTYCRNSFVDYVNDAKTETVNGGFEDIFVKETPIIAISSVEYSEDYGATYTEMVEYTDFVTNLEDDCITSLWTDGFTKLVNGYKITYTAGYEELPEDLKLGVMDLITYYLKNDMAIHSPKAPGTNAVQIEYITTTALPTHIRRVLDMYKRDFA